VGVTPTSIRSAIRGVCQRQDTPEGAGELSAIEILQSAVKIFLTSFCGVASPCLLFIVGQHKTSNQTKNMSMSTTNNNNNDNVSVSFISLVDEDILFQAETLSRKQNGLLYLTTQRVVWVPKSSSLNSIFTLPLQAIKSSNSLLITSAHS
jgi:hypothetical protein